MKTDLVPERAKYGLYCLEPAGDRWMDGWMDDL